MSSSLRSPTKHCKKRNGAAPSWLIPPTKCIINASSDVAEGLMGSNSAQGRRRSPGPSGSAWVGRALCVHFDLSGPLHCLPVWRPDPDRWAGSPSRGQFKCVFRNFGQGLFQLRGRVIFNIQNINLGKNISHIIHTLIFVVENIKTIYLNHGKINPGVKKRKTDGVKISGYHISS